MFLAVKEIRRGLVRFSLLALAIGLLLFLVLFQQALQSGLVTAFVGALENQNAPVIVYSLDGQRTLQGSTIAPDLEAKVRETPGIDAVAHIGQGTFTVHDARGRDRTAVLIGTDDPSLGRPRTRSAGRDAVAPGEAVGSAADYDLGDEITVTADHDPARQVTLTVVGLADDVQLSVEPTLFTDLATFTEAARLANPDAPAIPVNALFVRPVAGLDAATLAERVNAHAADADAVTREVAAATSPGVMQVRQSFQVVFALFALVVPLVTGLFFLIVTLQKARSLTLLRAVGARTSVLAYTLVTQVVLVTAVGVAIGVGLHALATAPGELATLTVRFEPRIAATWAVLFVTLAVVGSLASLRRVLRIDPLDATVGATA